MGTMVRLRIELADTPGSLAQVASIIASLGGNITSVDVQKIGRRAVDEVTVEIPDGHDFVPQLRSELVDSGVAALLSHQAAHTVDPVVGSLRRAAAVLGSPSATPHDDLALSVAELCSSPAVWVSSIDDALDYESGRFAVERNGAVASQTDILPDGLADRLPGTVWLLAVPDGDSSGAGKVIFVARPLAMQFSTTEIARIEAMMALHEQIARTRSQVGAAEA